MRTHDTGTTVTIRWQVPAQDTGVVRLFGFGRGGQPRDFSQFTVNIPPLGGKPLDSQEPPEARCLSGPCLSACGFSGGSPCAGASPHTPGGRTCGVQ